MEAAARQCLETDWRVGEDRWRRAAARDGVRPLGRSETNATATLLAGLLQRERGQRFASAGDARDHLLRGALRWERRAGRDALATLCQRLVKAGGQSAAPPPAPTLEYPGPRASVGLDSASPATVTVPGEDPAAETLREPLEPVSGEP